jgi:phosphoribosylanthranilate isomerase
MSNKLQIKVCGITQERDLAELVEMAIPYAGLIFYDKSPRFVENKLTAAQVKLFTGKIKKVGVFVNEKPEKIKAIIEEYELDAIQLHGDETPGFCEELQKEITVIKAFSIKAENNISEAVKPYLSSVDYFLLDTAGKNYGGNGRTFDWNILADYNNDVPYFLSGGIAPEHAEKIMQLNQDKLIAVDINSRFEISPGVKNISLIKEFLCHLNIA